MTFGEVALAIAEGFVGVRESARNRGPHVDEFLREAGADLTDEHTDPWCAAFVFYCANRAALACHVRNPLKRTCSVHSLYRHGVVHGLKVTQPQPGDIWMADMGGGRGHCGLVTGVNGGFITTIEGNTNNRGGREGDGVHRHKRTLESATLGYLRLLEPPGETNA